MNDIKMIIGQNLAELRKRKKYTQVDVGEMLQYSDKAVSKWEKGDSLPDIEVLYQLCQIYGVTLDYLTHEGSFEDKQEYIIKNTSAINKIVVTLLSISLIWFLVLIIYVYALVMENIYLWTSFIWGIPASFIILLVFNSIWGKKKYKYSIVSGFVWTFLTAIFLQFMNFNIYVWAIFLLGIPAQVAIILWSQIKR